MEKLPVVGLNGLYSFGTGTAKLGFGLGCPLVCEIIICGEFFSCKFSTRIPFVSWHLNHRPPVFPSSLSSSKKKGEKLHENGENELKSEREYGHLVHSIMADAEHPSFGGNGNGSFRSDFATHFLRPLAQLSRLFHPVLPLHAICMS